MPSDKNLRTWTATILDAQRRAHTVTVQAQNVAEARQLIEADYPGSRIQGAPYIKR